MVESRIRNFAPHEAYEAMHKTVPTNKTYNGRGKEYMNFRKKEKEILDEVLGSSRYDSRIRPAGHHNDTSESQTIT